MNGYSANFELGEVPEFGFRILIREQKKGNYRIFLVDESFDSKTHINTVKDNIPFIGFEIDQGKVCFGGMFVPLTYRKKGIPDLFFRILEKLSTEIGKGLGITKYINKPILAKKILGFGFSAIQEDIQAEIGTFGEIPTIKIVKGDVTEILSKVDLSGRIHPPFYRVDQDMKSTGIITPLHTRFIPPKKGLKYKRPPSFEVILNYERLLGNS